MLSRTCKKCSVHLHSLVGHCSCSSQASCGFCGGLSFHGISCLCSVNNFCVIPGCERGAVTVFLLRALSMPCASSTSALHFRHSTIDFYSSQSRVQGLRRVHSQVSRFQLYPVSSGSVGLGQGQLPDGIPPHGSSTSSPVSWWSNEVHPHLRGIYMVLSALC